MVGALPRDDGRGRRKPRGTGMQRNDYDQSSTEQVKKLWGLVAFPG